MVPTYRLENRIIYIFKSTTNRVFLLYILMKHKNKNKTHYSHKYDIDAYIDEYTK